MPRIFYAQGLFEGSCFLSNKMFNNKKTSVLDLKALFFFLTFLIHRTKLLGNVPEVFLDKI